MSESPETDTREEVLRALTQWIDRTDRPPSAREIAAQIPNPKTASTVNTHLLNLCVEGKATREGKGRRAVYIPLMYPDGRPWLRRAELLELLGFN